MPFAYATGKWTKEKLSKLQLRMIGILNLIKLEPKKEAEEECLSISDVLDNFEGKKIFVRSGKGSIDVVIYVDGVATHTRHCDLPEDETYDDFGHIFIDNIIKENKSDTIIFTGAFYHHLKKNPKDGVFLLGDKQDIDKHFSCKIISIRNFIFEGRMRKTTFIRQDKDGKYTGIDLGSGKSSFGHSDPDFHCIVNPDDPELTKENLIKLLSVCKERGIKFQ